MSISSKTTPFTLELFSFVNQLAGLIERRTFGIRPYHRSTGFKKHLPSHPA